MDPAPATKVLQIANSPLYARRRRSAHLRPTPIVRGLNATLTLALRVSRVQSLRAGQPNGVNRPRYRRRARLGASTVRDIERTVCERIGQSFRTTRRDIGPRPVPVTIGYATHGGGQRFAQVEALITGGRPGARRRHAAGPQPLRPLRGRRTRAGGAVPPSPPAGPPRALTR